MWCNLDTGAGWYTEGKAELNKLQLHPADRQFTVDGTFSGAVGFHVSAITSPIGPVSGPSAV